MSYFPGGVSGRVVLFGEESYVELTVGLGEGMDHLGREQAIALVASVQELNPSSDRSTWSDPPLRD